MLENYQIINVSGQPQFAVVDYVEFVKVRDILHNTEKLEDYLDYLHIKEVKTKNEDTITLDELKIELGLIN